MRNPSAPLGDIRPETLENMAAYWQSREHDLAWNCPFVLPPWLDAWWSTFAGDRAAYIFSVHCRGELAGIAPLMRKGRQASLIGDADVCDHVDVVLAPQHAAAFCRGMLDHLARDGVRRLVLSPVREDSSVMVHLLPAAENWGAKVRCDPAAQLFAMSLPASWEDYLQRLSGKERHEIRRKLRRLDDAGRVALRWIDDAVRVPEAVETFLDLFKANRAAKAAFMTGPMPAYFRRLSVNLAAAGLLKLYFLDLDGRAVAAALCVDDGATVYLYNNGYHGAFRSLSVGLLSKVLTIKASIRAGRQVYDFLKGSEAYKKRLGGRPIDVHRCVIELD